MNRERYRRVMQILDAVIDAPAAEHCAILNRVCEGDDGLRLDVDHLIRQQSALSSFLEHSPLEVLSEPPSDAMIERRLGPYRITESIGRGGMGAVYKAVRDDDEYKTEVAIKLIKRGMDTDYILRRFRNERQILANLKHPNIARLLDGGTTTDGLPYFVMEYIDGRAIDEYCNQEHLSIAARLKLFRTVCSAVNYAHQNLIVHRDLKPSNILVTSDGTPKLLDFGIAKFLHPDTAEGTALTAMELRVLTPDYASPEQVRGEAITTVSDVYSLGIVLYELLTGQRPYRVSLKNQGEVARIICEQKPVRPSRVVSAESPNAARSESSGSAVHQDEHERFAGSLMHRDSDLHGDLDAIVLMALRKEPARRYSSVEQFSEDIRRYLAGHPVTAREDTFAYRSAKFVARHRRAAIAVSLMALVLVGAIAATAWEAHVAQINRARADRRFNELRKLADSFMFELNDQIAKEPTKARELLVTRALEYLDGLVRDAEDDPSLQRELATAYQKIGDVQSELHGPNLGRSQSAEESYRKSLALRQALWSPGRNDLQLGMDLATSYNRMGDIMSKTGVAEEALANYQQALEVIHELTAVDPKNVKVRRLQAQTHIVLGRALLKIGSLREVLANFEAAVNIRDSLVAEDPGNRELRRELPAAYETLGYALAEKGDVSRALDLYKKSLAINESLLSADPGNARLRRAVFDSNWWVGVALAEAGKAEESLDYHRKALAIAQELSNSDPANIQARNDLADAFMEIANSLTLANHPTQALPHYRKAIAHYESVWVVDQRNAHARRQVYYTQLQMGAAQSRAGDHRGATETLRGAVEAFAELATADPANTEVQTDLGVSYQKLGEALIVNRDYSSAAANLRESLPLLEKLAHQSPLNVRTQRYLALTYQLLGNALTNFCREQPKSYHGQLMTEAESWLQKSLDLWKRMKDDGSLAATDAQSIDEAKRAMAICDAFFKRAASSTIAKR